MNKISKFILFLILAALFLSGCMPTADELYAPPKRSEGSQVLQSSIDNTMRCLDYAAPVTGENNQAVQWADLNGDGVQECLVYAKGRSNDGLCVLILSEVADGFELVQTVEVDASAFDQVQYADLDDKMGVELILGTRLTEKMQRNCTVYSFSDELNAQELLVTKYSLLYLTDLDANGLQELFLLKPAYEEPNRGKAVHISFDKETEAGRLEAEMSTSLACLKEVVVGAVSDGIPAVFVISLEEDGALTSDVFALAENSLKNISFQKEENASITTVRNANAYPQDVDGDGVTELPYLMPMMPMDDMVSVDGQELIRWYTLTLDSQEVTIDYTFHNYLDGWYLVLDESWASYLTVVSKEDDFSFYLWDETYETPRLVMTMNVDLLSAAQKQDPMADTNSGEISYGIVLEAAAADYGITEEFVRNHFHIISR